MQDTDLRLHPELRYSGEPRQELTQVDRLTSPNAHTLGHCSWPFWLPAPIATAHNSRNLGIGLALQRSKVSHLNVIQATTASQFRWSTARAEVRASGGSVELLRERICYSAREQQGSGSGCPQADETPG